ncbi:hypothetical protein D3C84_870180 [compost metagenome]
MTSRAGGCFSNGNRNSQQCKTTRLVRRHDGLILDIDVYVCPDFIPIPVVARSVAWHYRHRTWKLRLRTNAHSVPDRAMVRHHRPSQAVYRARSRSWRRQLSAVYRTGRLRLAAGWPCRCRNMCVDLGCVHHNVRIHVRTWRSVHGNGPDQRHDRNRPAYRDGA